MTPQEFASKIRTKYPGAYDSIKDDELVDKIIAKYPVYANQIERHGYISRTFGAEAKEAGEKLGARYAEAESPIEKAAIIGTAPLRAAGAFFRGAGKAIAEPIGQAIETTSGYLAETEWMQKLATSKAGEAFSRIAESGIEKIGETIKGLENKIDPDVYQSLKDTAEIATWMVGTKGATQLGKKAVTAAEKGVVKGVGAGIKAAEATRMLPKAIVQKGKENLLSLGLRYYSREGKNVIKSLEQSYAKIPLSKTLMRGEAETGKSFAKFMSKHPEHTINIENMKFTTWGTAQKLRQEVGPEAKALEELIKDTPGIITMDDFYKEARSRLTRAFSGTELDKAILKLDKEINSLRRQYGDELPLWQANKLKQDFWDRSPMNPAPSRADKLANSVDYKMGQSFKKLLEDKIPDAPTQALNQQIGDYYHSIEVLEHLHGGAAPRGRLGVYATQAGAAVVGGATGGVVGGLGGFLIAPKIVEMFSDPAMTTAFKRYIARQLQTERPKVAQQVFDIMKQRGMERDVRLLLEPPKTIPLGAETKAPAKAELIQAGKGPVGRNPKTGRFEKTYTSTGEPAFKTGK